MARSPRQIGETIPARFRGYCRACGQPYEPGASITKMADKLWVHTTCTGKSAAAVEAADQAAATPVATPAPASNNQAVTAVVNKSELRAAIRTELEGATLTIAETEVRTVVRDELAKGGSLHPTITIAMPSGDVRQVEGKAHAQFKRVLRLAACRRNILLIGPAGCGKTHLAEQVAEALGLSFGFISCSIGMSEGQLLGRLVPTGEAGKFEYLRSEFVKAYEEGGVFLFDELDAADSNTLLVINAALANGKMAVPNRPEKPFAVKHPDFICIAAGNTFGSGADRMYVGRNQLDESTLDRFRIGTITLDYDEEIEAALCPDEALRTRLQGYRQAARAAKLRRLVTTRFLRDSYLLKQAGATDEEIDDALLSGWSPDETAKLKGGA